jgi:hypothetical protein
MLLTKLKNLVAGFITVTFVLALGNEVGHQLMADDKISAEAKAGNLRDTLLVLDQQFWEAASKHDVDTLGRLFAGDYSGLGTDDTRYTKSTLLESYRQFRYSPPNVTTNREVVRIDERSAILTYEATFKVFRKNGQQAGGVDTHRRMLFCWVQRDGGWFIKFSKDTEVNRGPQQVLWNEVNYDLFNSNLPQSAWATPSLQWTTAPNLLYMQDPNALWQSNLLQPNSPWVGIGSTFHRPALNTFIYPGVNTFNCDTLMIPLAPLNQPTQPDKATQQLIDKVLNAHGGESALQRLTAFTLKIKETDASGRVSTVTHFVELPDRYRAEISRQGENATEVHLLGPDGMQHWRRTSDGKMEPLHLFGVEPSRAYWLDLLRFFGPLTVLRLKEPGYQLNRLDEIDVHFRPAIGIQLTAPSGKSFVGPERKLYFDKETGLLVKELKDHHELLYGAYKTLNGITWAQKWSERKGKEQEPITSSIQDFKIANKLDPALFQKP